MGAQNILRVLTEALLNGEKMDLAGGTLKWLPIVDDAGSMQIGNGTTDMDFDIYMGDANTYVSFDKGDATMYMRGVSLDCNATIIANTLNTTNLNLTGTLTVNTLNTTDLNVSDTLTTNVATINTITFADNTTFNAITCNSLNAAVSVNTDEFTANTLNVATALTLDSFTANSLTVDGLLTTQTLSAIPAVDDTGTFTIGNATRGMDFKVFAGSAAHYLEVNRGDQTLYLRQVQINTNAHFLSSSDLTVTGFTSCQLMSMTDLTCQAISVAPAGDDVGAVTIGSAAAGMDVKAFLGGATTYFELNRGDQKMYLRSVPLETNAAVTVNAAITSDNTIQGATINATTSMDITGTVNAQALTVLPSADDTGLVQIGNATHALDLTIFLGGATQYASFDRGDSKFYLKSVPLETNAAVTVNAALTTDNTLTAPTINTGACNTTGLHSYTGSGHWKKKYAAVNSNTTMNTTHYGGFIRLNAVADIEITLPSPTGLEGTWLDFFTDMGSNNTTFIGVNSTGQKLSIVGNSNVNTIITNSYGSAFHVVSTGDDWLFSPYEGTTFSQT